MSSPLAGKFFHSFNKEGKVEWQGQVVDELTGGGWHLVQLFNWLDGEPSIMRIVGMGVMVDWHYYGSVEQMNTTYDIKYAAR